MARKTSTRKPTPRRRAPAKGKAKPKGSFGRYGWLAAATLGLGWMVSDGRPVAYVGSLISPQAPLARTAALPARTASAQRLESRPTTTLVPPTISHAPRKTAVESVRTAALPIALVTPRPAPRLGPLKMPRDAAAIVAGPEAPAASQLTDASAAAQTAAPRQAVTPAMAPAGSEHHATRRLEMREAPDGASRVLASIDSGTEVHVLRAAGAWRYVASAAGRSEGWVDGTYLAGEASSVPVSPVARQPTAARDVVAAATLAPFSPTREIQAAGPRLAAPRTRLPPAAITPK